MGNPGRAAVLSIENFFTCGFAGSSLITSNFIILIIYDEQFEKFLVLRTAARPGFSMGDVHNHDYTLISSFIRHVRHYFLYRRARNRF